MQIFDGEHGQCNYANVSVKGDKDLGYDTTESDGKVRSETTRNYLAIRKLMRGGLPIVVLVLPPLSCPIQWRIQRMEHRYHRWVLPLFWVGERNREE